MLILQKVETGESFEISWIYDRGDQGYFLRVDGGKNVFNKGDKVILSQYGPKLERQIKTSVTAAESNTINGNVCVKLRNKRDLPAFKKALVRFET